MHCNLPRPKPAEKALKSTDSVAVTRVVGAIIQKIQSPQTFSPTLPAISPRRLLVEGKIVHAPSPMSWENRITGISTEIPANL